MIDYITEDGHTMTETDIMWRVTNSSGRIFSEPISIRFSYITPYNSKPQLDNKKKKFVWEYTGHPPYLPGHKHFYDYNSALKYITNNKN